MKTQINKIKYIFKKLNYNIEFEYNFNDAYYIDFTDEKGNLLLGSLYENIFYTNKRIGRAKINKIDINKLYNKVIFEEQLKDIIK